MAKSKARKPKKHVDTSFKVENIVASANLKVELDLFNIAMEVENVEYEPEQFPGAIMRLKELGTTLLLFKNGKEVQKLRMIGAQPKGQYQKAIDQLLAA